VNILYLKALISFTTTVKKRTASSRSAVTSITSVQDHSSHQQQKLPRLLKEYDDATDCDQWRIYGDLLYTYQITDTKGTNQIILNSLEDESPVKIPFGSKTRRTWECQALHTTNTTS